MTNPRRQPKSKGRGRKPLQRCPRTGKRRFRDHDEAVREMERLNRKTEHPKGTPIARVYDCAMCQGWHLTSEQR